MRRFPFTAGSGFLGLSCLFFRTFFCSVFVLICWSFFHRFRVPTWGVLEPKIDQNATYELLIFIDFILVFQLLLHLGGSYVGSMLVLLPHRFLHRFLVDLGIDFGALLGAFGGSKSIIFGINFGMIFACRSKSGLRAPKSGPRAPQERPRGAQKGPRGAQERPQSTQWAAKRAKCVCFLSSESRLAALYVYNSKYMYVYMHVLNKAKRTDRYNNVFR